MPDDCSLLTVLLSSMSVSAPFLPTPDELTQGLRGALPGFQQTDWVARTVSTNAELLARARQVSVPARPWLLGAHLQEAGRGRAGRTWQHREGANLMFSCAFDVFMPSRLLPALSPLAGVAACEGLRQWLNPALREHLVMKWPNDLQWRMGKLAGILVEVTRAGAAKGSDDHYIVIMGIGLNLDDARSLSQALDRRVADWREVVGEDADTASVSVQELVVSIARAWQSSLQRVVRDGLGDLPQRHAVVDALVGQVVDIIESDRVIQSGIACGVDEYGRLLLRTPSAVQPVTVGEVSARTHTPL